MKGCHNCKHAVSIAAGEYADRDWESVPCSSCDVVHGLGYAMEFDDDMAGTAAYAPVEEPAVEEMLPISVMQDVVIGLLQLRPELRDVIAWRFAGARYDDIALAQGVTMQCVEKRHRRAMKLWPVLEELFPEKVAKRVERIGLGGSGSRKGPVGSESDEG